MTPITELPILFSAPMVRAILAGAKTQTRRALRVQPPDDCALEVGPYHPTVIDRHGDEEPGAETFGAYSHNGEWSLRCPYGKPSERLWMRETTRMRYLENLLTGEATMAQCGEYVADGEPVLDDLGFDLSWWYSRKTCPDIHMPRWASRITLEVTGVRVERLQEISRGDAMAEGCPFPNMAAGPDPRNWYAELWESINGPDSWAANSWVWVVSFARVMP